MGWFKKKSEKELAADLELKKTLISLKAIAYSLEVTAEEFSEQLHQLRRLNAEAAKESSTR